MSKSKGFASLPCPKCGEKDTAQLYLSDLDTVKCQSCEEEYTIDDVRHFIKSWGPLLKWLDTAPLS